MKRTKSPASSNSGMLSMSHQKLSELVGVSVLDEILSKLEIAKKDSYSGQELQGIKGIARIKNDRDMNVDRAIALYFEQNDGPGDQSSATSSSKPKRSPKLSRNRTPKGQGSESTDGSQDDLQQKLVKSKKVALQAHVNAGAIEGNKLADAYRHGRQSQFLGRIISDTIADSQVVATQLQQLNDAVYGTLELPQDFVDALEVPDIEGYLEPSATDDDNDFTAGLGFTGDFARLANGELSEEEIAALVGGEDEEVDSLEEEEESETPSSLATETAHPTTEEVTGVIQLLPSDHRDASSQQKGA